MVDTRGEVELTQSSYTRGLPGFLLSLPLAAPGDVLPWELWTCGASQSSKCTARLGSLFYMKQVKQAAFSRNYKSSCSDDWIGLYLMQFPFPAWITVSPGISIWGRRLHCWLQCSLQVSLCSLLARCVQVLLGSGAVNMDPLEELKIRIDLVWRRGLWGFL